MKFVKFVMKIVYNVLLMNVINVKMDIMYKIKIVLLVNKIVYYVHHKNVINVSVHIKHIKINVFYVK